MSVRRPEVIAIVSEDLSPSAAWPNEWEDLAERSAGAATFTSRVWVSAWIDAYASGAMLRAIELRAGSRLVGALWLFRHTDEYGTRWLTVGSGNSDRLDPLTDETLVETSSRALLDALADVATDAPVELQQITGDSAFARIAMNDPRCTIAPQESCLILDLRGKQSAGQMLKKGMRYDLRRSRRLMEEHGGVIDDADPETADGLMDALIRLHTARWHARGENGVLADAATREMHRSVARQLVGKGLVLRALRFDTRIVACVYGFRSNGVEMCYLNGFDPEWSWLQPGKLLLADSIDRAIAANIRCFDMLRGQEDYKYRWPVITQPCIRIRIGSNDEEAGRTLDHRRCER